MDRDEYRRTSLEAWERMAAGWERMRERAETVSAPVREWLVRNLQPQPGQTVLELAAGPGETGFDAARVLGASGRLISSDRAQAMVEVARRRATELGLSNVEHRALDAEDIDLSDDSVDGALCRYGYMLMADPALALRETRRVLRPGGRLAFAVWSSAERNPWVSAAGRMFVSHGLLLPPEPGAPGMFVMGDQERTRAFVEDAGFEHVRMEEVDVRFTHANVDEYVERSRDTGGMFATVWNEASPEERRQMKAELAEAFAPYAANGRLEIPGVALCVLAS